MNTTLSLRCGFAAALLGATLALVDSACGQSANDECTSAIALVDGANGPYTNLGATTSAPAWLCGAGDLDVWFVYVPTCTGVATFDTCGADFDTVLEVFDLCGTCPSFANGVCNDDRCSVQSSVSVAVQRGHLIFLRVGGFGGALGTFPLNVVCTVNGSLQPDDECSGATPLRLGLNGGLSNLGYTSSAPSWPCGLAGSDRWFVYVSSCTSLHTIQTCGNQTNFDTTLEVLLGPCGCSMTSLACNDDACGLESSVTVALTRNQTYYIRVGGYLERSGFFDLEILPSGSGSFQSVSAGCGGTTLVATGSPNLGGDLHYAVSPTSGSRQYVWAGLVPLNLPLCAGGCSLGCTLDFLVGGSALSGSIPCQTVMVGAQFYVQGADFGAPGGCAAGAPAPFPLTVSDTILTTIGS
jgi:hypothetical protein